MKWYWSREIILCIYEVDFWFRLQQGRLFNSDLSGLKLSVNIANPCSKLLCTVVREVYWIFRNQTLVFRTWMIRQCNPVWVHKLADIITSLVFMTCALSQRKCDTCSWNKWECMSVNKSLTFINTEWRVNTATSNLSVSSESYYTVT